MSRWIERPEMVTLGAVGETREARAMYGIAATPLDLESVHLEKELQDLDTLEIEKTSNRSMLIEGSGMLLRMHR